VIGKNLASDPTTKFEGNPYKDWIEMYSANEYQNVATEAVRHLDQLGASRLGPGRFEDLVKTFRQATILEIGFWDMGLNLQF
jgi:thiaminase/transcriptional activator TenA